MIPLPESTNKGAMLQDREDLLEVAESVANCCELIAEELPDSAAGHAKLESAADLVAVAHDMLQELLSQSNAVQAPED